MFYRNMHMQVITLHVITMLMQAIQLTKYGKPEEGLHLAEIAEPGDPESDQILIRVEYAPINDSDLLVASGL